MPIAPLKFVKESIATEKYQLKKHLSDLFGSWQYESQFKNYFFLVADGDCDIKGNLHLDYKNDDWATDASAWCASLPIEENEYADKNYGVRGIIITGNLTVHGSIINSNMNDGPFLLVMGNVAAHNLVAGGGHMQVNGSAAIRGVSYGHYNDGSIHINGDLSTAVFINEDHDFSYKKLKDNKFLYDSNSTDSPELAQDNDGDYKIPKKLRSLLGEDILTWDDILETLCSGKEVLKNTGAQSTVKDAGYWKQLVKKDALNLKKVPKAELTEELCEMAVSISGYALALVPKKFITAHICDTAVKNNAAAFSDVPAKFKTKAMCVSAVNGGTELNNVPPEFIDYDMAYAAAGMSNYALKYMPPELIDRSLLVKFLQHARKYGYVIQRFLREPKPYTAEDIALEVVQKSFEVFSTIPAMYVTQKVFDLAESLYNTHAEWKDLCFEHSRTLYGGNLTETEIDSLIGRSFNYSTIKDRDSATHRLGDALEYVWGYQVDSDYILKLMQICENFQGAAHIPHRLMTDAVIDAMLNKSTTHIQYLPYDKITEQQCLRVVNNWHTSLSFIPVPFRSITVCKAALGRCKADNDYLLDEVIAAIPKQHYIALNLT
jgi:hypothetical protein